MHIIIVGGGLAGLATYLQIRKRVDHLLPDLKITVLEKTLGSTSEPSRVAPSSFAGGYGIALNGLRVIYKLNQDLYKAVREEGYLVNNFEFRTSGNTGLGRLGEPAGPTAPSFDGPPTGTLMIDRSTFWSTVRRFVPDQDVRGGAQVRSVDVESGVVQLGDGTVLKGDLVIGADGLRSAVRKSVIDDGEPGRDPEFQLLMNLGGYFPTSHLGNPVPKDTQCVMTFGSTGFFAYTPYSSTSDGGPGSRGMWWSTYTADPAEVDRKTTISPEDPTLLQSLHERHGSWADPCIQRILSDLTPDTPQHPRAPGEHATLTLATPTWIVPKLPRWHRGRAILIGDAAHALPSTSGQGVSQAFEDSIAIAIMVEKIVKADGEPTLESKPSPAPLEAIERAASELESRRKPRVEKILDAALKTQNSKRNMGAIQTQMMYGMMWVFLRTMSGSIKKDLEYDYEEDAAQSH